MKNDIKIKYSEFLTNRHNQIRTELEGLEKLKEKELNEQCLPQFVDKYVGKYFIYENGDMKNKWNVYARVDKIESIWDCGEYGINSRFEGIFIEVNPVTNSIRISKEENYINMLQKEISEAQFNKAWNKMIDLINKI